MDVVALVSMARPAKTAKIDGTLLIGTRHLTITSVRAVLASLPAELRNGLRAEQFRYAMRKAQESKLLDPTLNVLGWLSSF